VDLVADGCTLPGVVLASTFIERLTGIHRATSGVVMIPTRSIHTFTVRAPLHVIALDEAGRVLRSAVVGPRTVFTVPGASWMVECRRDVPTLPVGSSVRIMASCADARNARRLRHPHREPR
jgi:hypothetical protein